MRHLNKTNISATSAAICGLLFFSLHSVAAPTSTANQNPTGTQLKTAQPAQIINQPGTYQSQPSLSKDDTGDDKTEMTQDKKKKKKKKKSRAKKKNTEQ